MSYQPTVYPLATMSGTDAEIERINAFLIDETYLFSHYFDRTDLFEEVSEYYSHDDYRFEVPADVFESVRDDLSEAGIHLVPIEDLEPYCVVTEKYDKHADILRQSVVNWERREHRFFVLPDQLAVERALGAGADRVEETPFVLGV